MQSPYEAAEAMDGWLLAEAERWCDTHLYGPDEDDGWEGEDDGEDGRPRPNGDTYDGVDEGMVLTNQLFDKFRSDFKASLIDPDGGDVDE